MDNIEKKVEYFLKKHNLLNGEPVLVAFSGGYDSMCLLDVCSKLKLNLTAIHLNHNWRGIESKNEEEACKNFCIERKINFYSETLPPEIKKTETSAREARYEFFKNCAKKFGAKAVLTAHNANDNAETLIYRITKGTGISGLCGIYAVRGIYYRPLLDIKREDIENYCIENGLKPNNDSSNTNIKYKRNLIRHKVLPVLKEINQNLVSTLNSLSELAEMDNEIINLYLETLEEPYNTQNFINYKYPVKSRLVYNLFISNGLEYDREKISRALSFIEENKKSKSGKTLSLSADLRLFASMNKIEIIKNYEKSQIELEINKCGKYEFENKIFIIEEFTDEVETFPKDEELKAYVDLTGFETLALRHRKDGDKIKPLGCNGVQKLKKYLNEKKFPQHEKDKLILLTSKEEVLWVPSAGLSDRIKVVTKPTHVLKLIDK